MFGLCSAKIYLTSKTAIEGFAVSLSALARLHGLDYGDCSVRASELRDETETETETTKRGERMETMSLNTQKLNTQKLNTVKRPGSSPRINARSSQQAEHGVQLEIFAAAVEAEASVRAKVCATEVESASSERDLPTQKVPVRHWVGALGAWKRVEDSRSTGVATVIPQPLLQQPQLVSGSLQRVSQQRSANNAPLDNTLDSTWSGTFDSEPFREPTWADQTLLVVGLISLAVIFFSGI